MRAMAMEPPREEGVRSRPIDEERGSRGRHVSKQDRRKKNLEVSMTHTQRERHRERERVLIEELTFGAACCWWW